MAADPSIDPGDIWKWVIGGFGTILATLVGVIWNSNEKRFETNEERLEKLEGALDQMVTKAELEDALPDPNSLVRHSEYEQNRQEVRADMIKIHDKLDRVIAEQHISHTTIMTAIAGLKNSK